MNPGWIKKVLFVLLGLVLLVAAGLAYLVATFDAEAYKARAIEWVKTHRDRTLAIDGPLKLSVLPRLAIEVSKVRLSEKGRADEFLGLDKASLSLAVWPLLRKQVVIDSIQASGLRVAYLRDAKGVRNIDDLLAPSLSEKKASDAGAQEQAGSPQAFDVRQVRLDDLQLMVRDEIARLDGVVAIESLTTGRIADAVESPVALKARLVMSQPALKGQLTARTLLTLQRSDQTFRLRNNVLSWQGDAFGASAIDATLKGDFAYDGQQGSLQASKVELDGGATLGALKLAGSRLTLASADWITARRSMALSQLQLKLVGTHANQPLTLALDWPQIGVEGDAVSGSALSGKLSLQGPTAIEATLQSAPPKGTREQLLLPQLAMKFSVHEAARKLNGSLQTQLLLKTALPSVSLQALDATLQTQTGGAPPSTLKIQGKAEASAERVSWALSGALDNAALLSDGSVILATDPMTLKAGLRIASLDLNRWLPQAASTSAASGPVAPGGKAASDTPVDLSPLRSLQGEFHLRAGQLALRQYRIADAALDATLEGGMLNVQQLAGKTWGGAVNLTAFADARASRVTLKGSASNVDVNALLKDVAAKDTLEGTGRVVVDLDTAGRSVDEMKSRLKGTLAMQLRDGSIKGINLAKSLRQAKAALRLQKDAAQPADRAEKTDFSELSGSFDIDSGIARNVDLDAKSPFLRLGGQGQVDVGQGRIDYTARATVANTSKGQDGADLAALKGVTIPVRLTGPLDAMQWKIEWSAVAAAALKSEVAEQALDPLKAKLRDKLGLPPSNASAPAAAASQDNAKQERKDKLKETLKGLLK